MSALKICEERLKRIGVFVDKIKPAFDRQGVLKKTWAGFKFGSIRPQVQEMQNELRDAILSLQVAISTNISQLQ